MIFLISPIRVHSRPFADPTRKEATHDLHQIPHSRPLVFIRVHSRPFADHYVDNPPVARPHHANPITLCITWQS